jgi:hypothetical protein
MYVFRHIVGVSLRVYYDHMRYYWSFRDWAGDRTSFARDVVEAALAHAIENKTEAAYRHSDALEKRRKLTAAWAAKRRSAGQRHVAAAASRRVTRSNVSFSLPRRREGAR